MLGLPHHPLNLTSVLPLFGPLLAPVLRRRPEAAARGGDRDPFNDPRRGIDLENFGKPKRRLRRSLDSDFQAADDDDETKRKKRAKKRARISQRANRNDDVILVTID